MCVWRQRAASFLRGVGRRGGSVQFGRRVTSFLRGVGQIGGPIRALCALADLASPSLPKRRALHPLGDRGGICVAQHGLFNWAKPGLHSFLYVPCRLYHARQNGSWYYGSFSLDWCSAQLGSMLRRCTALTPVSSSFEWHHFDDRSALFTNSFRRHRDIVSANQKRGATSLNLRGAYFKCEPFCSPLILLTVEGPRGPLAGGSLGL
jgi:hypothetical protein